MDVYYKVKPGSPTWKRVLEFEEKRDRVFEIQKKVLPKLGAHVTIETSAKGPIVNIRHDRTVRPVDRCYRYGEELYAMSRAAELKQFLALLQNRY